MQHVNDGGDDSDVLNSTMLKVSDRRRGLMLTIALVKSCQVRMMVRRGYEISPEEEKWLDIYDDVERWAQVAEELEAQITSTRKTDMLDALYVRSYEMLPNKHNWKKNLMVVQDPVSLQMAVQSVKGPDVPIKVLVYQKTKVIFYLAGFSKADEDMKRHFDNILHDMAKNIMAMESQKAGLTPLPEPMFEPDHPSRPYLLTTERSHLIMISDHPKALDLVRSYGSSMNVELFSLIDLCMDKMSHALCSISRLMTDEEEFIFTAPTFRDLATGQDHPNSNIENTRILPKMEGHDPIARLLGGRVGQLVMRLPDEPPITGSTTEFEPEYIRRIKQTEQGDGLMDIYDVLQAAGLVEEEVAGAADQPPPISSNNPQHMVFPDLEFGGGGDGEDGEDDLEFADEDNMDEDADDVDDDMFMDEGDMIGDMGDVGGDGGLGGGMDD